MKTLVSRTPHRFLTATAFALLLAMNTYAGADKILFDFQTATNTAAWQVVNDDVMGGVSTSSFRLTNGVAAFQGKVAALLAASPGSLGGLRGLVHLRSILGNIRVLVLPDQVAVSAAYKAFGDDGALLDEKQRARVEAVGARLADVTARMTAGD